MAHIPYGYKIENGHAVPEPEQAKKLNDFIEAYLGGLSIKESRKASGIELSQSSLLDYLRTGTYAGTEYYPPIVPDGTREQVMEELERRTHPGFSIIPDAIPVYTKFQTAKPAGWEAASIPSLSSRWRTIPRSPAIASPPTRRITPRAFTCPITVH